MFVKDDVYVINNLVTEWCGLFTRLRFGPAYACLFC